MAENKLLDTYHVNGFTYVKFGENDGYYVFAQFAKEKDKAPVAYELVEKTGQFHKFPKDEDFGRFAWAFRDLSAIRSRIGEFEQISAPQGGAN